MTDPTTAQARSVIDEVEESDDIISIIELNGGSLQEKHIKLLILLATAQGIEGLSASAHPNFMYHEKACMTRLART
jgi:hypothetical protein